MNVLDKIVTSLFLKKKVTSTSIHIIVFHA